MRQRTPIFLAAAAVAVLALVVVWLLTRPGPVAEAPAPTPTPTPTATPEPTPTPEGTPTPSPRAAPAEVETEVLVTGLEIPWSLDIAPDGRLFVTERAGHIRVVRDGQLEPTAWATLEVAARAGSEMGLLGIALHPDFAQNGYVYVYHTYAGEGGALFNRVVRLREQNGRGVEDRVILDGIPGANNHDGGRIKFGPDGKLYVSTGDAQIPARSQDPESLNGKILRLEPDGSVPDDNPTPGSPVYALGLRHPQGLAWHPDGTLYATDHGPSGQAPSCCHDEVNRIEPGGNYGWPEVWGEAGDTRFIDPVYESGPAATWAPSGAAFVDGGPLHGSLLFAVLRDRHLHRVVFGPDGREVLFTERLLDGEFGRLRDVVQAPDGSFYVLTSNHDGRGQPVADDDRVIIVRLR